MKFEKFFKLYSSMSYTIRSSKTSKVYNCKKDVPIKVDDPLDYELFSNKNIFQEITEDGVELTVKVDSVVSKPLSYTRAEQPKIKEVGNLDSIEHLKPFLNKEYYEELKKKLGIEDKSKKEDISLKNKRENELEFNEKKENSQELPKEKISLKDLLDLNEKKEDKKPRGRPKKLENVEQI